MGNKNKKKSNPKIRKIKIRLADPNIPDSYVCEIFDSSLENEDEPDFAEYFESQDSYNSKPKNYFEILMSNCTKKNLVKDDSTKIKFVDNNDKQHKVMKKHEMKTSKMKIPVEISNQREEKQGSPDSSDDDYESLLEIQNKCKSQLNGEKLVNDENLTISKQCENIKIPKMEALYTTCDVAKKKSSSILNYFSKMQEVTKKNLSNKVKENKLNVIIDNQNLFKTCSVDKSTKTYKEMYAYTDTRKSVGSLNKENIKLAPVFMKKNKKVLDFDTQRSRIEFLHKGLPSTQKNSKSNDGDTDGFFNFPLISHIQQKSDSVHWSIRQVSLPFINTLNEKENSWQNNKKFSINISHFSKPFFIPFENLVIKDGVKFNKETLKSIKCKYVNLNLDLIIDGFKQKRDKYFKCTNHPQSHFNNEYGLEIYNALWCEKYKPNSDEILGNLGVVKKLRKWLESWKTFDKELKMLAKSNGEVKNKEKNNKDDSDTDDGDSDFIESDNERCGLKSPNNVCLLSGPNGCGKTTLVQALANELDFNILEVNASSKRTGKIVLSDLQEATQSHKFHHTSMSFHETKFQSRKNQKQKNRKKNKNSKTNVDKINDCKISLILIEDADIVFEEHDDGFCSAVASLVQSSKRPLIFLTNDPTCVQDVFKSEQILMLEMERPSFSLACAVLDIITLLEGVIVNKEALEFLVSRNRFDLRKSLLEMQFWVQCNERTIIPQILDLGNLWWGLFQFLFNQDIRHFEKQKRLKRKRSGSLFDSSDEDEKYEVVTKKLKLNSKNPENCPCNTENVFTKTSSSIHSYLNVLDLVSTLDVFRLSNNQEPIPIIDYKPKDSLSLEESLEEVTWNQTNLKEKICSDLIAMSAQIFSEKMNPGNTINFRPPSWKEIRWRVLQDKANEELSVLVPLHNIRDKRSVYLDYLPVLRNVCRYERNRFTANNKRKNRFYHYLNNLGIEISEEALSRNCEILERE